MKMQKEEGSPRGRSMACAVLALVLALCLGTCVFAWEEESLAEEEGFLAEAVWEEGYAGEPSGEALEEEFLAEEDWGEEADSRLFTAADTFVAEEDGEGDGEFECGYDEMMREPRVLAMVQNDEDPLIMYDPKVGHFNTESARYEFDEDAVRARILAWYGDGYGDEYALPLDAEGVSFTYECREDDSRMDWVTLRYGDLDMSLELLVEYKDFVKPGPVPMAERSAAFSPAAHAFIEKDGTWSAAIDFTETGDEWSRSVVLEGVNLSDFTEVKLTGAGDGVGEAHQDGDAVKIQYYYPGEYRLCLKGKYFGDFKISLVDNTAMYDSEAREHLESYESFPNVVLGQELAVSCGEEYIHFCPPESGTYMLQIAGGRKWIRPFASSYYEDGEGELLLEDFPAFFHLSKGEHYLLKIESLEGDAGDSYTVQMHQLQGLIVSAKKGAVFQEDCAGMQWQEDELIPGDDLLSLLDVHLLYENGQEELYESKRGVSLFFPEKWKLGQENEVLARLGGESVSASLLLTAYDDFKGPAPLDFEEEQSFIRSGRDSRSRAFVFAVPVEGEYTLHAAGEDGSGYVELDVYDRAGKKLWETLAEGENALDARLAVELQWDTFYFLVVKTNLPAVRVGLKAKRRVESLRLEDSDRWEPLVYGMEKDGSWNDENTYVFQPRNTLMDTQRLAVTYDDGTVQELSLRDKRVTVEIEEDSYDAEVDHLTLKAAFWDREVKKEIPVLRVKDYFGDSPAAVTFGELIPLTTESRYQNWMGTFRPEKDGMYRFRLYDAAVHSFEVMDERGWVASKCMKPGYYIAQLKADEAYYIQSWSKILNEGDTAYLLVSDYKEPISLSAELTRREPFFRGEVSLGAWEGNIFKVDFSKFSSWLRCTVRYADGTSRIFMGTDREVETEIPRRAVEGTNSFVVRCEGLETTVSWLYKEMMSEGYEAYPKLSCSEPVQVTYEGPGSGRLSFTASEEGVFWISCEGETAVGIRIYNESGRLDHSEEPETQGEKNTRISWHMYQGQTIFLETYPLEGEEASYLVSVKQKQDEEPEQEEPKQEELGQEEPSQEEPGQDEPEQKKEVRLSKPSKVKVKNMADGILVSWGEVTDARLYQVYRKTGNGKYEFLAAVTENSCQNKNVKPGVRYQYKVRAKGYETEDTAFLSSPSKAGKPICFLKPCRKVKLSKKGKLTWKKVQGATGYQVMAKQKNEAGTEYRYRTTAKKSLSVKGMLEGSFKVYVRPMVEADGITCYGAYVYAGTWKG